MAESIDQLIAEARAKIADRNKRAAEIAAAGKPVKMSGSGGRYGLIGADVSTPGGFRFTRFDAHGPVGHTEHATLESAAREALQERYVPTCQA